MRLILKNFLFLLSLLQTSQNLPALPAIPNPQQRSDLSAYFEELKALHERLKLELNSQNPFNNSIELKNLRKRSSLLQSLDLIYTDPQGQRYLRVSEFNDLSRYINKLLLLYHPDKNETQDISPEEKKKLEEITQSLNNLKENVTLNIKNIIKHIFKREKNALEGTQPRSSTEESESSQEDEDFLFSPVEESYQPDLPFLKKLTFLGPTETTQEKRKRLKKKKKNEMEILNRFKGKFFQDLETYENELLTNKLTITFTKETNKIVAWHNLLMQQMRNMRFEQAQAESSEFLTYANQKLLEFFTEKIFLPMNPETFLNINIDNLTSPELEKKYNEILEFINMNYSTETQHHLQKSMIEHLNRTTETLTKLMSTQKLTKSPWA